MEQEAKAKGIPSRRMTINDLDLNTKEGKIAWGGIIRLSTTVDNERTPDEILECLLRTFHQEHLDGQLLKTEDHGEKVKSPIHPFDALVANQEAEIQKEMWNKLEKIRDAAKVLIDAAEGINLPRFERKELDRLTLAIFSITKKSFK